MIFIRVTAVKAGLRKHSIPLDNDKNIRFSYYERGVKIPGQASMVFVHGFSSSKESWITLVDVR